MTGLKKHFQEYEYQVAAFYCFNPLFVEQITSLQEKLTLNASENNILGTIIIASEGINGTVCGKARDIKILKDILTKHLTDKKIEFKYSYVDKQAFRKFKVKHKVEIVTMGRRKIDPRMEVGTYIIAKEWNDFISDPETIIIDTRNDYEIGIGTFKGSINPHTSNFSEFPSWVEEKLLPFLQENPGKRIGMFCTGGIRCEKATSFLVKKGISDVHHLQGGILRYLEDVPEKDSLWEGECFVFDQRVSLNHQLLPGDHLLCYACGMPLNSEDRNKLTYIRGVQCHYCKDSFSDSDRVRFAERQKHYDKKSMENINL